MFKCLNERMSFLLINKSKDWTSHDVVAYIRNIVQRYYKKVGLPAEARRAKVGHAGTLDPFATGLLIVGVGRDATKKLDEFKNLPKTYVAEIMLGAVSDTYDSTGTIINHEAHNLKPNLKQIKKILKQFIGPQEQIPPMYSAKKIKGKKLYELARAGTEVERQPHKIAIYKIKLLEYNYPRLKIEVNCSAGTYIRALAHDIGIALGVGAYCAELERIKIGKYNVKNAIELKALSKETLEKFVLKKAD